MKKSIAFSTLVSITCYGAFFVSSYAIKGERWLDLVFLMIGLLATLFSQKVDDMWHRYRKDN